MTKRAVIIHGWEGSPKIDWKPWLKDRLEQSGFKVFAPQMPNANHPKMNEWVNHISKIVRIPDKDCYFIGHSLGCITILRYIETLKEGQKVGGTVLVAGFTSNLGYDDLENFFTKRVDWDKIKSHCSKFVAIHSDNDPDVSLHYGNFFKEELGAKVIIQHDMGHFTIGDGITKLPIALESIIKISK